MPGTNGGLERNDIMETRTMDVSFNTFCGTTIIDCLNPVDQIQPDYAGRIGQ